MLKMIMAVDERGGIGKDGNLPWHIPSEFKYFREYTDGCLCIMGRKTFEDIKSFKKSDGGQFLPGRTALVITSNIRSVTTNYAGVSFHDNPEHIMDLIWLGKRGDSLPEMCVVGGKTIYEMFSEQEDLVDEISITYVEGDYDCDTKLDIPLLIERFEEVSAESGDGWKAIVYRRKGYEAEETYDNT